MKILHINASYKPAYIYGGPIMSVTKLAEELAKAGHDIDVFTTTANGKTELVVKRNVKTQIDGIGVTYFARITKDHSHFSPTLLTALWKQVKKFDAIHIHGWWNLVSVFSALITLLKGRPMVISPRGMLSSYSFNHKNATGKGLLHNLLGRYLLNRSYIHATSPAEYKAIKDIIRPKRIFDIPNFVRIADSSERRSATDTDILKLIFLSRIDEKKGLDILINALPQINVPYHLTIAGSGKEEYVAYLKNLAKYNSSAGNISWIGFQDDGKFDIMAHHDLLVLPSHDENFGNVVIESLSVGTPVLISKYVGLANYILQNNLGWVCDTSSHSVSDSINDVVKNHRKMMVEIQNTGPSIIHHDFDEDNLTEKYVAMYRQIVTNG